MADGVCIRLYSEDDYEDRMQYTPPEIRRANLAAVILQMMALRLGKIEQFPFIDPPETRSIRHPSYPLKSSYLNIARIFAIFRETIDTQYLYSNQVINNLILKALIYKT